MKSAGYRFSFQVPIAISLRRLLLGLVLVASASGTQAAEDTVEIGPNLLQSILNQINTYTQRFQDYEEYAEQAMRWEETFAQYQQQLVKIQGMLSGYDLPKSQKLETIDEYYLVQEKCGQGGGFLSSFKINLEDNYLQDQYQICANIRITENKKFNATVVYLQETAPNIMKLLKMAEDRRQSSNENGNVDASTNDAARISNEIQAQGQTWTVQMQACDTYISLMQDNQKTIVENAMKGGRNPLGTLVKTTALKAALSN